MLNSKESGNAIHINAVKVKQCYPVDGIGLLGFLVIHNPKPIFHSQLFDGDKDMRVKNVRENARRAFHGSL